MQQPEERNEEGKFTLSKENLPKDDKSVVSPKEVPAQLAAEEGGKETGKLKESDASTESIPVVSEQNPPANHITEKETHKQIEAFSKRSSAGITSTIYFYPLSPFIWGLFFFNVNSLFFFFFHKRSSYASTNSKI
jgi:hypothetical protein